jgi:hypothetical protein
MKPGAVACLLLASCGSGTESPREPASPSRDFAGLVWVDGAPDLGGRVALVRWWTHPCELCSGSVPALARLSVGVPLVAVYHPKPRRDVPLEQVRDAAKRIGMPGILAIDPDWAVLDRWAPPASRQQTSLTFLLDTRGHVRYVLPGGLIGPEDESHLHQRIDALLAEK